MNLKKTSFLSIPVLLFLVITVLDLAAQDNTGWTAPVETVEKMSKSRPELNFYEEKVPEYTLPDLLITLDGEKVNSARNWNKVRRPEISNCFARMFSEGFPRRPIRKASKW